MTARYRPNDGTAWYLGDHLGTIHDIVDQSGQRIDHLEYDSFGRILSGEPSDRFTYTGREYDATEDLYYYRARYYDPKTGRFISEDPLGLSAGDTNLYRYVGNSPLNFVDPSGEQGISKRAAVGALNSLLLSVGVPAAGRVAAAAICKGAPLERDEFVEAAFGESGQKQAATGVVGSVGVHFFVPKATLTKSLAKALGIVSLAGTAVEVGYATATCFFPQILVGLEASFENFSRPFELQGPEGQIASTQPPAQTPSPQGPNEPLPFGGPFPDAPPNGGGFPFGGPFPSF